MTRRITIALVVVVALLTGCSRASLVGSGNLVTVEKDLRGFDKLDISHGFKFSVRQAEDFGVVIRIDDNLEKYVVADKKGSTLRIGLDWNLVTLRTTLEAEITMPELTGLELSGGADGTVTGFESTKDFDLDVSGGCDVTLTGSAGDATIEVSGGAEADLSRFSVVDADVRASGGGGVTVNVSGRLDADASGGSDIRYVGSPTLGRIEESGGGSIRRQ